MVHPINPIYSPCNAEIRFEEDDELFMNFVLVNLRYPVEAEIKNYSQKLSTNWEESSTNSAKNISCNAQNKLPLCPVNTLCFESSFPASKEIPELLFGVPRSI